MDVDMYAFVHGKDVIGSMKKVLEDELLPTANGQELASIGDYICTDLKGNEFVVSSEYADAMMQIKVVSNPTSKKEGIDKELMGRKYIEMGDINYNISNEAFLAENEAMKPEATAYINGNQNGWDKPINETYNG